MSTSHTSQSTRRHHIHHRGLKRLAVAPERAETLVLGVRSAIIFDASMLAIIVMVANLTQAQFGSCINRGTLRILDKSEEVLAQSQQLILDLLNGFVNSNNFSEARIAEQLLGHLSPLRSDLVSTSSILLVGLEAEEASQSVCPESTADPKQKPAVSPPGNMYYCQIASKNAPERAKMLVAGRLPFETPFKLLILELKQALSDTKSPALVMELRALRNSSEKAQKELAELWREIDACRKRASKGPSKAP